MISRASMIRIAGLACWSAAADGLWLCSNEQRPRGQGAAEARPFHGDRRFSAGPTGQITSMGGSGCFSIAGRGTAIVSTAMRIRPPVWATPRWRRAHTLKTWAEREQLDRQPEDQRVDLFDGRCAAQISGRRHTAAFGNVAIQHQGDGGWRRADLRAFPVQGHCNLRKGPLRDRARRPLWDRLYSQHDDGTFHYFRLLHEGLSRH
jgi:hypothetical protein